LENYEESQPIILSASEEISIYEIAQLIAKYMEFDGYIICDRSKPNGQYRKPSSNKKLLKYMPDYKFTSLEDGIKETVN